MIINKKLFDDLFLESHSKLAMKSLQTLNNIKDFIIFQNPNDEYNIFEIKDVEFRNNGNHCKIKGNINVMTNYMASYIIYKNSFQGCTITKLIGDYDEFDNIEAIIRIYPVGKSYFY